MSKLESSVLHHFDRFEATPLAAALQTFRSFHNHTLLIEHLIDQVWRNCVGEKQPTHQDLEQWCGSLRGTEVEQAEDPREDGFLGRVIAPHPEDLSVFLGRVSNGDRALEDVLVALANYPQVGPNSVLYRQAQALVFLSAKIASRLSLVPFTAVEQENELLVPQWRVMEPAIMAMQFSSLELAAVGLTGELLNDLVAMEPQALLPTELWEHGATRQLVRRPLLKKGDTYIYILPCRCLDSVAALVADAFMPEELKKFCIFLAKLQFERHIIGKLSELGIRPRKFEDAPSLPCGVIRSEVGLIDVDTAIHITLLTAYFPDSSTLSWAAAAGAPDGFVEYLTDCQRYILERMKTRRLLSLVVFAGIPGSFSLSFPDPLKGCVTTALPIYDLATLEDSRDRLLEFLHSVEHSVDLSNAGVNVMNWAGPMNFHAYRKHTGTALFPMGDSSALHRMMMLEPTFLAEWRQEIRIATDRRLLHHPLLDKAIEVVRWGSRSPRPSERQRAIYRSVPLPPMTGQTGVDCFVCEGVNGFLWFVKGVDQKLDSTIEQALQHVLKMAIQWLGVAWCHAEDHGLRCQLELCLRFDESIHEDWIASLNVDTMQLDIRFSLAGLNAFHSPTNEPERNFIRCIVGVLCKYLPHGLGDDLQAHIDNAQADPNARHFHRVISRDAATWVQNDVAGACYWPSAETRQLYRWRVLVRDLGLGAFQCSETNQREALDGLVEGLWKEIEEELSELNLSHFVRACLRSITKARADLIQLDLTTGALLAVHPAKDQEQSRIHSWREGLNAAPPALRTLVEIAAYSCPRGSGEEKIGDDRLMALMVRACLLIETSQIRFGVFQGFIAPDVSFNEEGELIYDAGELGLLMKRYSEQTNQEWDLGNVASYGRQIGTLSPPADEEVVQAGSEFDVAFVAEFGVSVPKLGECITRLENYAVRGSVCSVLYLTTTELAAILDHLDEPALKGFIESFSLPLRSGRYEDLAELKEREVHPWLHRRQLSLIARPMVPDGVGPDARFLIPVGLLRQGIDLRIGQWRRGEMGAQSARLDKMKTWVGAAKDDWGKRFEKAVIDRLEAKGFRCLGGKMMPFYGAPGNPNLGDLDVLAWHSDKPDILVVECKNLLLARNLAEVIDELREFSEHPPNGAINALTKHIRRFNWIRDNWAQASKAEGMPNRDSPRLRSVLLFNASGPVGLNLSNTVVEVFYSRQFIDAFC